MRKKFEWGWIMLIPGLGYIAVFILLSLIIMIAQSLGFYNYTGESVFTLNFWKESFDPMFVDALLFSLKMGVLASILSIIICYPLAMLLQKSPMQKTLLSIIKIPVFVPALVGSFLIINIIDYHGIVNELLIWIGVISEPLRMRNDDWGIGVLLIHIWKNVPYQMIIMFSALESIRKDLKDAARNLGANAMQVFTQVILPLSLPSALVSVILVFIRVFNDFAVTNVAGPLYPTSLANLMHRQAYMFNEWNASACIGVMMMLASIILVCVYTAIGKRLEKME